MADLERRSGSRMTRRQREQRAYQLVLAGGAASAVALVTGVLAAIGLLSWGAPVLAVVVALLCVVLFRRTVSGR